jgi:hypothetical protein
MKRILPATRLVHGGEGDTGVSIDAGGLCRDS